MTASKQLADMMRRIYQLGLTTTSGGNLSIMAEDGMWITPSGVDKGNLTPEDIVCVRPDGRVEGRFKPSIEAAFHAAVYKKRPDIRAIVHAHPPYLSAFALMGDVPKTAFADVAAMCGEVVMTKFEIPGSLALSDVVAAGYEGETMCALLENHGAMTGGETLLDAFLRFELLEQSAQTQLLAVPLGTVLDIYIRQDNTAMGHLHIVGEEEQKTRELICSFARRANMRRLFVGANGAISVRFGDGLLITPHGLDRNDLTADDIVWVDENGVEAGKQADESLEIHRRVYQSHGEIGAILNAHPAALGAFAVTGSDYDTRYLSEGYVILRKVKTQTPNVPVSPMQPVSIVSGLGCMAAGATLVQAFDRLEVAECGALAMLSAPMKKWRMISDQGMLQMQHAYDLPDYE